MGWGEAHQLCGTHQQPLPNSPLQAGEGVHDIARLDFAAITMSQVMNDEAVMPYG
jgi:hypothetical protein